MAVSLEESDVLPRALSKATRGLDIAGNLGGPERCAETWARGVSMRNSVHNQGEASLIVWEAHQAARLGTVGWFCPLPRRLDLAVTGSGQCPPGI